LELLPYLDTVLIMTIKAGFGGQQFLPGMLDKVRDVRRRIPAKSLEVRLEVDGGIAADTIEQAAEAGADAFVAGTAVYGADDPADAVRKLRHRAARARAAACAPGWSGTRPTTSSASRSSGRTSSWWWMTTTTSPASWRSTS